MWQIKTYISNSMDTELIGSIYYLIEFFTTWPLVHIPSKLDIRIIFFLSDRNWIKGSFNVAHSEQASLSSALLLPKQKKYI